MFWGLEFSRVVLNPKPYSLNPKPYRVHSLGCFAVVVSEFGAGLRICGLERFGCKHKPP